jgi:hypothetical protein
VISTTDVQNARALAAALGAGQPTGSKSVSVRVPSHKGVGLPQGPWYLKFVAHERVEQARNVHAPVAFQRVPEVVPQSCRPCGRAAVPQVLQIDPPLVGAVGRAEDDGRLGCRNVVRLGPGFDLLT